MRGLYRLYRSLCMSFFISRREVIKKVKEYFKNFNSQKIVKFSHNEAAFIKTKFYKNISYDYVFDINL